MKNLEVLKHFISDSEITVKSHNENLYTYNNNKLLINYNTIIARKAEGNVIIVNTTKYSQTTTRIQNTLIELIENDKLKILLTQDYYLLDYYTVQGGTTK